MKSFVSRAKRSGRASSFESGRRLVRLLIYLRRAAPRCTPDARRRRALRDRAAKRIYMPMATRRAKLPARCVVLQPGKRIRALSSFAERVTLRSELSVKCGRTILNFIHMSHEDHV